MILLIFICHTKYTRHFRDQDMQFYSKGIWCHRQPVWYKDIFPKPSGSDEEFRLFPSAPQYSVRRSNVSMPKWEGHTNTATELSARLPCLTKS